MILKFGFKDIRGRYFTNFDTPLNASYSGLVRAWIHFLQRLTAGAKVRRTPCQADALDGHAAAQARLPSTVIHAKFILILAFPPGSSDVIPDARAALRDGTVQYANERPS